MQEASDAAESGMVAIIGLNSEKVKALCEKVSKDSGSEIVIANYLVDGNYAISGSKKACDLAKSIAKTEFGARMSMPLAVAGAFHTSFMEPAVPRLREALSKVEIQRPRIPVISNVDAKAHFDPEDIKNVLAKQVTSPVLWENIMSTMLTSPDHTKSYEIGPGSVCKGIVKRFGKKLEVVSVQV